MASALGAEAFSDADPKKTKFVWRELYELLSIRRDVRLWHLADNPVAPAFVRYWTKADIDRHGR
jgi:hypothetical protein